MSRSMRLLATTSALGLLVALTSALPASARNCNFPGNPVPNCGFATDLSGSWTFTGDSAVHVPTDGASAPGCAAVDRHDGVHAIEVFTGCLPASASVEYGAGLSARVSSGAIDSTCSLSLVLYTEADCNGAVTEEFGPAAVSSGWGAIVDPFTTLGSTQAVQLRFACFSSVDFVVRVDDFWFAPALFRDGFESGDSSAWSAVVP